MKNLFLYALLSLYTGSSNIKIDGLLNEYYQNQNIRFEITNFDSSKKYYYISVEYCENKIWSELINDINNPKLNMSLISEIDPKEKIKVNIPVKKIFYLKNFLNFKLYRLKVSYGDSNNKLNRKYYSKNFKIVN
ncbi:hypothetical protein QGN23_00970 [Chryseobacterium gotjawalense]|uniref:Periplasmic protein n=1 Tax=Chryseobacterium gotjawalense TaxID=3042315 RepID=A0ABY8RFS9_9FLAO|nr:hypothetical protein [Chryseobacterium sp. wdc7]WHF51864.1 hypothetical protein QGN23_00970 [Chryseobacterium sp. wdc7]